MVRDKENANEPAQRTTDTHTPCGWLPHLHFQPWVMTEIEKTDEDGGVTKWLKHERKNMSPTRGLRPHALIPPPGNVNVRVCASVWESKCVWWILSERTKARRAPSSPRLCRPWRLWAAGGQSPRRRSHRPGRCCCKDQGHRASIRIYFYLP